MIKKSLLSVLLFVNISYANDIGVDCLIIKEENSIICKYTHERITEDKMIKVDWIEPDGKVTRSRDMIVPAGHGSVYDFRYLKGRTPGEWTFKVTDKDQEFTSNFIIN